MQTMPLRSVAAALLVAGTIFYGLAGLWSGNKIESSQLSSEYIHGDSSTLAPASMIREFRTIYPLSVSEYEVGHRYSLIKASKRETGGGEGVEIVVDEPHEGVIKVDRSGIVRKSQYTVKIIHLASKAPQFMRVLAPSGSLEIMQESWNDYPRIWTVYSNMYMGENFQLIVETRYEDGGADKEDIFDMTPEERSKRFIDKIDIVNDKCDPRDYRVSEDPTKFHSIKTGRGPFVGTAWDVGLHPSMCAYSLYRLTFRWWGLQSRIERMIIRFMRRFTFEFVRMAWCTVDEWFGMSMDEIVDLEVAAKDELDLMRKNGPVKGMSEK